MHTVTNEDDKKVLEQIDRAVCTLDDRMPALSKAPVITNWRHYQLLYKWGNQRYDLSVRRIADSLLDNNVVSDVRVGSEGISINVHNHRYFDDLTHQAGPPVSNASITSSASSGTRARSDLHEDDAYARPRKRARTDMEGFRSREGESSATTQSLIPALPSVRDRTHYASSASSPPARSAFYS